MKMHRRSLLASAMVGAAAWAVSAPAMAQTVDIKFGFAAPMTGPQSHYGEEMQNGILLALAEANAKKIKVGGKVANFTLVTRDDQADPRIGVQVAQQLVDAGISGMLGHFNSGTTIPASRLYNEAGVPQIAMATAPEYTRQGYNTAFRMMTSDTQQGAAVGGFMVKNLKAKKVAIVDDRTAYGQGLADQVEKAVKAGGGQVARREYTTDKATDFASILTNVRTAGADALFYAGTDAQSGPLKRQMKQLGLTMPLLSGEMTRSDTFLRLAADAAEGTYASLAGVPLETLPGGKAFQAAYKAQFKKDSGVYSPYAYDGAWNMIHAIEQAGSADPAKYLPKLAKLQRKGLTSNSIAYDDAGDLKEVAVTIYQVKGGKWVQAETVVGQAGK